jgi:hypothetical protein
MHFELGVLLLPSLEEVCAFLNVDTFYYVYLFIYIYILDDPPAPSCTLGFCAKQGYRRHRHCRFSCTGPSVAGSPALERQRVEFWTLGSAPDDDGKLSWLLSIWMSAPSCTSDCCPLLWASGQAAAETCTYVYGRALPALPYLLRKRRERGIIHDLGCCTQHCCCGAGVLRLEVPIPYQLPALRYSAEDRPWMTGVRFPGLDSHGLTLHQSYASNSHYGNIEPDD